MCVELSQLALQYQVGKISGKQIIEALRSLLKSLDEISCQPGVLDQKLADYVFFPLSYLFRHSATLPIQATELSLRCLLILISSGWCGRGEPELCKQLLVLLTFLIGGNVVDVQSQDVNEVISTAALECLSSLFNAPKLPNLFSGESLDVDALLVLGHVVTVTLNALTDGPSNKVQEVASEALGGLVGCVSDSAALRKFMPGIASNITKVLHPTARSPRSSKVLEGTLGVMSQLLQKTMRIDEEPNTLRKALDVQDNDQEKRLESGQAWMKATSAQVKLALANIVRLRYHGKHAVVDALFHLCTVVLQDCREALPEAASMMLETSVIICGQSDDDSKNERIRAVQHLISCDSSLVDMLKISMHDWVSALPRVMLSNDTATQCRQVSQIAAAYQVAAYLDIDLDVLDLETGESLCQAVSAAINIVPSKSVQPLRGEAPDNSSMTSITQGLERCFGPLLLVGSSQTKALQAIQDFISNLDSATVSISIQRQLLKSLTVTSGSERIACLWLCSRLLHIEMSTCKGTDLILDYAQRPTKFSEEFAEAVYSFCIDLLSCPVPEEERTWQMQALALEVLAFRSCHQKQDFRPELVDALYPVVERLGSGNPLLREHAMTSLDVIATACDYQSSSDLVIQNVDYLVNSVALKFNTFDISPQTPHVILMMIKLCGPRLIPYLDDLVGSVFSALASFHGYPRLVESLCSVLHAIVDESRKGDGVPSIEESVKADSRITPRPPTSISEVADILKQQFRSRTSSQDTFPNAVTLAPERSTGSNHKNSDHPEPSQTSNAVGRTNRTPSKTYTTVQSIVRIGQHYLTHESPKLRRQLLQLTATGCATLSHNEDEFLPLVNDIWPVVVRRLYDEEPFVSIAACETVSDMFRYAGDFVASRVDNEWSDIRSLYRKVHARMLTGNQGENSRGRFSAAYQMWDALVKLCCRLIEFVRIDASVQDDLMDLIGPYVGSRSDVRDALNAMNPDAVWLEVEAQRQRLPNAETWVPPITKDLIFTEVKL